MLAFSTFFITLSSVSCPASVLNRFRHRLRSAARAVDSSGETLAELRPWCKWQQRVFGTPLFARTRWPEQQPARPHCYRCSIEGPEILCNCCASCCACGEPSWPLAGAGQQLRAKPQAGTDHEAAKPGNGVTGLRRLRLGPLSREPREPRGRGRGWCRLGDAQLSKPRRALCSSFCSACCLHLSSALLESNS